MRFLALYFLSGLAGSALVYWAAPEYTLGGTIGASGAIFGLMGALVIVALKVGGDMRGILTWIGINFVITFVRRRHLLAGPRRRLRRRHSRSARSWSTRRAGRGVPPCRWPAWWPRWRLVIGAAAIVRLATQRLPQRCTA